MNPLSPHARFLAVYEPTGPVVIDAVPGSPAFRVQVAMRRRWKGRTTLRRWDDAAGGYVPAEGRGHD